MSSIRVDWRTSLSLVGRVIKWLSATLLLPISVAIYYAEWGELATFGITVTVALGLGFALERLNPDPDLGPREAFLMVALSWLAVAIIGSLPYMIAGQGTVAVPINALFESMSGFTTTGATVMGDISFDTHSRALLIWRQETQWLGGMGIVVLAVAILPELSVGGTQLLEAETPGPGIEKLTPRIAETARVLWVIYLGFTIVEIGLLYGLHLVGMAPEMTFYNAVAHGLTTLPTGGFSPEARSIEAFSAAVQWVIIPFMVIAGTNFALFWHVLDGNRSRFYRDAEFRFYLGLLAVIAALLAGLLFTGSGIVATGPGETYDAAYVENMQKSLIGNLEPTLRHAVFQSVAITTTTGYASIDFEAWSPIAQYILLIAMFIGGSAGSTGGSIKIVRWLVILKSLRRELFTSVHPDAIQPVRLGGLTLDETAVRGIYSLTLLYLAIFVVGTGLVFVDATRVGLSLEVIEAVSAVAATLGNVGPGFGLVGPMGSYLEFPVSTKVLMVGLMWIGRLEIFPVLVLLTREYWHI